MKMSDVFALPVEVVGEYIEDESTVVAKFDYPGQQKAATHAINRFDGMVNAVDVLLNHPELADRDAITELLTRAKGGCDE